jgi:hypothetical protein
VLASWDRSIVAESRCACEVEDVISGSLSYC